MSLPKERADISELLTDRKKTIEVLKTNMIPTVAMSTMSGLTGKLPTHAEYYNRILQNQLGITLALIHILKALGQSFEFMPPPPDSGTGEQPQ